MVFCTNAYSVLVVSATEKFQETMSLLLPSSDYYPVRYACSIAAARRAYLEQSYDFVIINAPLPDDIGIRFATQVSAGNGTVALMLMKGDVLESNQERMTGEGIFALQKPTSSQMISQALRWMAAARERLRMLESKSTSIEEKMEEIRLVNRAKWLLIEHLHMSESDAHRHIEKKAMDECTTRREISHRIIEHFIEA